MVLQVDAAIPVGSAVTIAFRFVGTLVCLAQLVRPPALLAQSAEQRRAIESYADSLERLTDTVALHREEATLLAAARLNRSDPLFHLRLGLVALRLGELGGSSHFDEAASEFKSAAQLAPRWPYAWFGLGRAELSLDAGKSGASLLTQDAQARAAVAFSRALTLEPAFAARLEDLARDAVRARQIVPAQVVRLAIDRSLAAVASPRLMLALGRVQRELGDSAAMITFERLVAATDSSALALLELGRSRLVHERPGGFELYLAGAGTDDPVALQEYRADLQPLATGAELADFDLRRGASRADMVRRFWLMRDQLEFRPAGERLAEHFHRVAYARREFLVADASGAERFDDRGRMHVRHGPPDDRAVLSEPGIEPNESWRYRRDGRDILLHFVARQAPNEFRLVESVLDVTDYRSGSTVSAQGAGLGAGMASGSDRLLRSRAALAPLYRDAAGLRQDQRADFLARERGFGRRGILFGTGSDSYPRSYERELGAWGALRVAGYVRGEPRVQLLFAIPAHAAEAVAGSGGMHYRVRVRFTAVDEGGVVVASIDSVLRIETLAPVADHRSVTGRVSIPVPAGRLLARAAVELDAGKGTFFALDTLRVPPGTGGDLELGDPLIGSRRAPIPLLFDDGLSIALAAGVVRREQDLDLAVDVFGVEPKSEVELRVLAAPIEAADGGPAGPVLRWRAFPDGKARARVVGRDDGAPVRWRVLLRLDRLRPGDWALAVDATDRTGRTVRRVTEVRVEVP
ncbi:MAG: GWxTD domain-containing protein [Gemmatimonadales bacterium]